jgi:hypothetical protein
MSHIIVSAQAREMIPSMFPVARRMPVFFMHIPKTAGTSMRLFLEAQYTDHDICLDEGWYTVRSLDQLAGKLLIRGHFQYNLRQSLPPETRLLTVLRDPVARTLSSLKHLQRDSTFAPEHSLTIGRTLGQIIRLPEIMIPQRNIHAAYLCASTPPSKVLELLRERPQAAATANDPAAALDLACARLHEIDFLATVEELPLDIQNISDQMNYHPAAFFPFANEAPGSKRSEPELTAEELDILRAYNDIDLKIYEYAQKLVRHRRFEAAMRKLVQAGTYQIMAGNFEIDIGNAMPGSGWHLPEREGKSVWRWTGPGDYFSLELPLRSTCAYEVSVRFNAKDDFNEQDFQVMVNNKAVSCRFSRESKAYVVNFTIPASTTEATAGFCQIVFRAKASVPPGDTRSLGVAMRQISFTCHDGRG